MKHSLTLTSIAAIALLSIASTQSQAVLLLEEGFAAGGATPAANQYQSDPDSTNGVDGDSLTAQGPAGSAGFNAGDNWTVETGNAAVASVVFPRVLDNGLGYTDSLGNQLVTTDGAADWHRDNSTGTTSKRITRVTNLVPSLPEVGYFSALVQFTDGTGGQIELRTASNTNTSSRTFFVGFDSDGNAVAGTGNTVRQTATVFAADQTYLLFGELTNDGTQDNLRLWLNPSDLSNPTLDAPILNEGNIGSGWVGSNPIFTIRDMSLFSETSQFSQFIFDEIRLASTPGEALPFTGPPIPEPTTAALGLIGMAGLLARRRRAA